MIHICRTARTTRGAAQSIDAGRRVGAGVVAGGSTAALRRRGLPSSVSVMVLPSWVWTRSDGVEGLPFWRRAAGTGAFWPYRNLLLPCGRCEAQHWAVRAPAAQIASVLQTLAPAA